MRTYFGRQADGSKAHIKLAESMEDWHVRCIEQREAIRGLREDIGTAYSRKAEYHAGRERDQRLAKIEDHLDHLDYNIGLISRAVETLAGAIGADTVRMPSSPGDMLPAPEGGWPASH